MARSGTHKQAIDYIYGRGAKQEVKRLPGGGKIVWNPSPLVVEINKTMAPVLKKSADIVANIARDLVPISDPGRERKKYARSKGKTKKRRRTGKYKKSWQERKPGSLLKSIKVVKSKFKDGGYIVKVGGRDTFYWFFVEYGTSKMYPTWFMNRALRIARSRIKGQMPSWVGHKSTGRSQSPKEVIF